MKAFFVSAAMMLSTVLATIHNTAPAPGGMTITADTNSLNNIL